MSGIIQHIIRCRAVRAAAPLLAVSLLFLVLSVPAVAQAHKPAAPAAPGPPVGLILGACILGAGLGAGLSSLLRKPVAAPQVKDSGPGEAFAAVPTPLAILDSREKVLQANDGFGTYFGMPQPEGESLTTLLHPDDLARTRILLQEVFNGDRRGFSASTRFFHPNGTLLHTQVTAARQGDKHKPASLLVAVEDTSALVEAQTELEGAREAIHALYEVIAGDKQRDFDGKINALLQMGCNRFRLPVASLGRFDKGELELVFVSSTDRRIRPALRVPLNASGTAEAQLLGLPHLPSERTWRDFPYLSRNQESAYLGAPVVAGDRLFGMLSFAHVEARPRDFSTGEIELLQLMAEWVGGELERENARFTLEEQQTALVDANSRLEALATHDSLTELKNRRAFNEKLAEEWSRANRYKTPLSMLLLDVDHFKSYNDTFGHPAGDEVLRRVAGILASAVRVTDFAARYGGEEFVLLLPNTDAAGALILAERVREAVEEGARKERVVTVSCGVVTKTAAMPSSAALISGADEALYASKATGRNRVTAAQQEAGQPTTESGN